MIQIEISISEMLVRKLKALSALLDSPVEIEDLVVDLMDEAVSIKIASLLGLTSESVNAVKPVGRPKLYTPSQPIEGALDDGLGDEDESDPGPVDNMFDLVPKGSGLSDKALEEDMSVGDPDHEAKAEAVNLDDFEMPAEQMFSQMVGLPVFDPADTGEIDDRILKRRKKLNIRGRVTPATHISEGF